MKLQDILRAIRRADEDYHMIEDHDRIAVGISGGKDSMVLLIALHMYSKFPGKHFSVVGIHISLGFPDMDFSEVLSFCKANEIEFHIENSHVYEILKRNPDKNGKIKCSLCSKFKKALVIDAAKKYQCNKTAFGHHANDAVETLLLNAIYGGRIATFKPKMFLTNTKMMFIRPMIYCFEADILSAQQRNHIPYVINTCPNDGDTKRQDMKEILAKLYQHYPSANGNFLYMLSNLEQVDLWQKERSIRYEFQKMSQDHAEAIVQWHDEAPYSFYDVTTKQEKVTQLLSKSLRNDRCFEASYDHHLVGFFMIDQNDDTIEIVFGLRPDLCGNGNGVNFLKQIETYVITNFQPKILQLTIATCNHRAIKMSMSCDYEIIDLDQDNGYSCLRMQKQL